MAILPGSLDYLYHNGIVNSIPYDAYAMTPITPSGMAQMAGMGMGFNYNQSMGAMHSPMSVGYPQMNGSQYLQAAQTGMLYDTYTHPDIFVKRNLNSQNRTEKKEKGFKESITDSASKLKDKVDKTPKWVKGLAAIGVISLTAACLFKGKKTIPPQAKKLTFFQKIGKFLKK